MDSVNITSSSALAGGAAAATTNTTLNAILAPQASSHAVGMMGSLSSGIYWILQLHYWLLTFMTFTLPTFLFNLFSTSFSFNMNFTTLYVFSYASFSSIPHHSFENWKLRKIEGKKK